MINPQLLDYIHQQLSTGVSKEEISKALISNGWQVVDINEAFASIAGPTPVFQSTAPTLGTQMPGQTNFQPAVSGHKGAVWAVATGLLVLVGAGGAFAAYQAGLFTTSPIAPVTNNEASITPVLPVVGTAETASSTDQTTPSATPVVATSTKVVSSVKTTSSNLKENTLSTPSNIQLKASTKSTTVSKPGTPTEDPSYIVTSFTTLSPVSTLRFNLEFAKAGEGFVRIWVDGMLVREIDQRYVPSAVTISEEVYIGGATGTLPPGRHELAIRLDGFGANPSGVLLTDVTIGMMVATTTSPQ